MDTAASDRDPKATRRHPVDLALVVLSPVVIALSMALHEYAQAGVVSVLLLVAATKLRDPHAGWLQWTPRIPARG